MDEWKRAMRLLVLLALSTVLGSALPGCRYTGGGPPPGSPLGGGCCGK